MSTKEDTTTFLEIVEDIESNPVVSCEWSTTYECPQKATHRIMAKLKNFYPFYSLLCTEHTNSIRETFKETEGKGLLEDWWINPL